jgi:Cytochrome C biogenesis protein transmembrane region
MNSSIFFGDSVTAAVMAGVIALFAPCCISVMLPAYLAGSFQNRRALIAMTFVFATGIATVILPLTPGASALRQVFVEGHRPIYVTGGLLMLGLAAYTLLGGQLHLPMPGRRAGGRTGPLGVYSLGVFSGVATSCCAPVLAGVIALSGVTDSFAMALGPGRRTSSAWSCRCSLLRCCGNVLTGDPADCSVHGLSRGASAHCVARCRQAYLSYLEAQLAAEVEERELHTVAHRLREAHFPGEDAGGVRLQPDAGRVGAAAGGAGHRRLHRAG